MTRRLASFAALCIYSAIPTTAVARAQRADRGPATIPVLILVPQADDADHPQITITRRNSDRGYVIVVPRQFATAVNFSAAIGQASHLMDQDGDAYRSDKITYVAAKTPTTNDETNAYTNVIWRDIVKSKPAHMNGIPKAQHTRTCTCPSTPIALQRVVERGVAEKAMVVFRYARRLK